MRISIVNERIKSLINSIEMGEVDVTDQDVIDAVYQFTPSYTCETAAQGYFALVSSILYFRPLLEKRLLRKAIEPLYFLGINDASIIMLWAEDYLKKENKNKYLSPTTYGMMWLKNFHTKNHVVDLLLHEIRNENENKDE